MGTIDRERWRELSPHLDRAIEMPGDELASWLASLRAEAPELAADLEALLADREALAREGFLEDAGGLEVPDDTLRTVGPYRVIRRIGEGGMGIVFLAEQTDPIHREVALKVIRPGLDSEKVLARFASERQMLANMNHPGISKVYDAGVTPDGRPWVAMEHVAGASISQYCDDHRSTIRERLRLFLQVCAAIQHAHQKGVIHRDIKPSNLLVTELDGRPVVKVIDFGIAKALTPSRDEAMLTQTGLTLGTPEYMSPEQAGADGADVDTRSDVYALGVVLYELLAGARPFAMQDMARATPLALLEIVRDKEPPKLTSRVRTAHDDPERVAERRSTDVKRLTRELGGELEWITQRALEKQPSRRYSSAAELGADIERFLKGEAVLAGPPSTLYRIRKLARRHRVAAAAIVAVSLAITVGAVVSTLALLRAVRAERLSTEQLRESLLNQALTLTNGNEPDKRARALAALQKVATIAPDLDARNAAIAALSSPGFRVRRRWNARGDGLGEWPDTRLTRFARAHADGSISIHAIDDDSELMRLPPLSVSAEWGVFSPDGAWLAVVYHDHQLRLWNLAEKRSRRLVEGAGTCQFTPDGKALVASSPGRSSVFPLGGGDGVHAVVSGPVSDATAAVHPAEPLFFIPDPGSAQLAIRRTKDGALARSLPLPALGRSALWSADGASLITSHQDFSVRVWNWPAMGAPRLVLRFHEAEPVHMVTDPSGRWLATGGWDTQIGIFDLRDGQLVLRERGTIVHAARDRPAFLLENGPDWTLVELEPPVAVTAIAVPEKDKGPREIAWSGNGRWLATAGPGGVRLIDPASGDVRALIDESAFAVRFTPDSSELRAVTIDHLRAWTLPSEPRVLPWDADRPTVSWYFGGISPDGASWVRRGTNGLTRKVSWSLGRFGDPRSITVAESGPSDAEPALSADGAWLAWGNWHGHAAGAKRLGSSDPPVSFPAEGTAAVAFSQDDRTLVVTGPDAIRFYSVGSWKEAHALPRRPASVLTAFAAFSHDSRLCAIALPLDRILLVDVGSGRELGSIPAARRSMLRPAFSADDRWLAVPVDDHHVLIWDVPKLRRALREVGLDWEESTG